MQNCVTEVLTKVEWRFSGGDVVVDVGYSEGVDRRLAHSHPQQADEEDGEDDGRDFRVETLRVFGLLGLAFRPFNVQPGQFGGVELARQTKVGRRRQKHVRHVRTLPCCC